MPLLDERTELMRVRDQLLKPKSRRPYDFDMSMFESECGTAGCIAGWVYFNNKAVLDAKSWDPEGANIQDVADALGFKGSIYAVGSGLSELFYMHSLPQQSDTPVRPSQAAKAIDNYLASGDPKWSEVLNVDPA